MADKTIAELIEATSVQNTDLFVLEQASQAKKLTGATLIGELATALDGHGGISSITLKSSSGLLKTYQITYADGTTSNFTVSDGNGISAITLQSTTGLIKTYRIAYTNGTHSTFSVSDGNGIANIEFGYKAGRENHYTVTMDDGSDYEVVFLDGERGEQGLQGVQGNTGNGITGCTLINGSPSIPGSYVTYRLSFTNGNTFDFSIWNGADGGGSGDMLKAIYDTQNLATDIYQYVREYVDQHSGSGTVTSVNGKTPVSGNVTLAASDVGAVPTSRTVNGKALSSNVSLNPADIGAVPTSRTVNGKALSSNVSLNASDVGAVPTSRTVNGKPLTANVELSADDVNALSVDGGTVNGGTQFNDSVGFTGNAYHYGVIVLNENSFGDTLPASGIEGQLFFLRS